MYERPYLIKRTPYLIVRTVLFDDLSLYFLNSSNAVLKYRVLYCLFSLKSKTHTLLIF